MISLLPDAALCGLAASALGQIEDEAAVDSLIRALNEVYSDSSTPHEIAAALARIGSPKAVETLFNYLTGRL